MSRGVGNSPKPGSTWDYAPRKAEILPCIHWPTPSREQRQDLTERDPAQIVTIASLPIPPDLAIQFLLQNILHIFSLCISLNGDYGELRKERGEVIQVVDSWLYIFSDVGPDGRRKVIRTR